METVPQNRSTDRGFHLSLDGRINVIGLLTMLGAMLVFLITVGQYMADNNNRVSNVEKQVLGLVEKNKGVDNTLNDLRNNNARLSEVLARMDERQASTLEAVKEIKLKLDRDSAR